MSKKQPEVKLSLGLRDGKPVIIHELTEKERGRACNCVCPLCKKPLIARLGEKNQWLFAHCGAECNIVAAQETALHRLGKEIIAETKEVLFPALRVDMSKCGIDKDDDIPWFDDDILEEIFDKEPIKYRSCVRECDDVALETRLGDVVPDIIVRSRGRECLIEIAVTHFVDDRKERKIKERGLCAFQIDLSKLHSSKFSREEVAKAILSNHDNRKWINNPVAKELARKRYLRYIKSAQEKQQRREKIRALFDHPVEYKKTILSFRNESYVAENLNETLWHMGICNLEELPFFLDIPITGEIIFPCDRRIWQSALFFEFVFNGNMVNKKAMVHIEDVLKWNENRNELFSIEQDLMLYKIPELDCKYGVGTHVVFTFFDYLSRLGFLNRCISYVVVYKLAKIHSLVPPNERYANKLQAALNALSEEDRCARDVDKKLLQLIEIGKNSLSHSKRTEQKRTIGSADV